MKSVTCPAELVALFEIHCGGYTPKSADGTYDCLAAKGLIVRRNIEFVAPPVEAAYYWSTTKKGEIYIEALLSLPLPIQEWRIPEKEEK